MRRLEAVGDEDVRTTIVNFEEQMRGWTATLGRKQAMADQIERYRRLHTHLKTYCEFSIVPFEANAATEFQRLRKRKLRLGTMDMKIAAIALANKAKLLSRNLGDFRKVDGLDAEDWST